MTPDSLEIVLLYPDEYPDTEINEDVIRTLLKKHPERFRELLGGGQALTGTLEVFFDGDAYQVWHEVVTEDPGDEYLGVNFSREELADARSAWQKSVIDALVLNKPSLQKSKAKKNTGPFL